MQQQATVKHPAADPTDSICPVCHAGVHRPCRGLDFLTLPSAHAERTETTPLFDALLAGGPR